MKKCLLLCAAMLLVGPAAARAQINLQYTDCSSGVTNVNNACTSNTGTIRVIASFIAPAGTTAITGVLGEMEIILAGGTVPPWWQAVVSGSCRGSAISVALTNTTLSCVDYFNAVAMPTGTLGCDYYPVTPTTPPDRARLHVVVAIPPDSARSLEEAGVPLGAEVFAFTIKLTMTQTVGEGSCAGCAVGACWVLKSLRLTQPAGVGDLVMVAPGTTGAFVTWQGGSGIWSPWGNPCITPVRATSWGQVKSLYR